MGRKKKIEADDKEQSARFIELAEQIQTDNAEERFEEAMGKVVMARRGKKEATKEEDSLSR